MEKRIRIVEVAFRRFIGLDLERFHDRINLSFIVVDRLVGHR